MKASLQGGIVQDNVEETDTGTLVAIFVPFTLEN